MISPFEYIIVLISIILGMGITQILSGVAGMILRWDQVKPYWSGHTVDMREFYLQNCPKIFIFILSLSLLSIANNILISGASWKDQWAQSLVALIAALVVFFDLRQDWVHKIIVIFLLLTTIIAFVVEWDVLLIFNTKP